MSIRCSRPRPAPIPAALASAAEMVDLQEADSVVVVETRFSKLRGELDLAFDLSTVQDF